MLLVRYNSRQIASGESCQSVDLDAYGAGAGRSARDSPLRQKDFGGRKEFWVRDQFGRLSHCSSSAKKPSSFTVYRRLAAEIIAST